MTAYDTKIANWNSTKSTKASAVKVGDRFLTGRSDGWRTVERIEQRGRMVAIFTGYPRPLVVGPGACLRVAV